MIFDYTAEIDQTGDEIGGVVSAEPVDGDYRPVFAAAQGLVEELHPRESVTVTSIGWLS